MAWMAGLLQEHGGVQGAGAGALQEFTWVQVWVCEVGERGLGQGDALEARPYWSYLYPTVAHPWRQQIRSTTPSTPLNP
jgi:hypothetical protein